MSQERAKISHCLLSLAAERGLGKTFCPSEAARRLDPERWRQWMTPVHAEAVALVRNGLLRCTQQGKEIEPEDAHGPIRLSLPSPK